MTRRRSPTTTRRWRPSGAPTSCCGAARYGRGSTRLRLGDAAGAREDLEAVAADDPEYRDVARLLDDLGPR